LCRGLTFQSGVAAEGLFEAGHERACGRGVAELRPAAAVPRGTAHATTPAGRGGGRHRDYPQGTRILDAWVHDIGLLQKQSSAYFQAVTWCATVDRLIDYNMPRAAINVNDGAGGNLIVADSLLTDAYRESNDHGPINSRDGIPYGTSVPDGVPPDIMPGRIEVTRKLIVANYNVNQAVDNDDGYWHTHGKVLAYGGSSGLKSDFGGHDLWHERNLYVLRGSCAVLAVGMDSFFTARHE
jgi:hypothetical protein